MSTSKSDHKLRFGLVGTGVIVRDYHLQALLRNPRAEVAAAANLVDPKSLEDMTSRFKIPRKYTDFDDLARDPDVDAVVIGVANYLNAPVSIKLLQAGKHVLCEKPMALSVKEAEAMVEAASASGRKLMIAHVWRSDEEMHWLRDVVRSGRLGKVFKAKIHAIPQGWGPEPGTWRTQKKLSGGGAMADIAIHGIDALHFVFGDTLKPTRVYATMGNHFRDLEVEDTAAALVDYDNGMTVQIDAGYYCKTINSPHGAIELFGTEGYARMLQTEVHGTVDGRWGVWRPETPRREHISPVMYEWQMDNFIDCIVNDTQPICDATQAITGIRVVEAAYQSAQKGEAVTI